MEPSTVPITLLRAAGGSRAIFAMNRSQTPLESGSTAERLVQLGGLLRHEVRGALRTQSRTELTAIASVGVGDHTFGIDVVAERAVDRWLEEMAATGPLSLLTEDTGWRHVGPQGPLRDFDHGGPRISLDPIDGTRNLMHELRPAWVIAAACGPGTDAPRIGDVEVGALIEIPCLDSVRARELVALRSKGLRCRSVPLGPQPPSPNDEQPLWEPAAPLDEQARLDGGYFPFFGFEPRCRAAAQELSARVFERLENDLGIDTESVLDDQYISSGGQLALLALGTYRAIIDARLSLGNARGFTARTAKPYDVAGAILVAEEAGAVVRGVDGGPLDFPLDATTPIEFCGYANDATFRALAPLIRAALSGLAESD